MAIVNNICTSFDLGEPFSSQRIASGLMHTSYFLNTESGSYVTRLLGYVDLDILNNERHVQTQLHQNSIPATHMLTTNSGNFLHTIHDNNVTVAERLAGVHPSRPASTEDCFVVGQVLGNFHQAVESVTYSNERSALLGRNSTAYRITKLAERESVVAPKLKKLYAQHVETVFDSSLPKGVLHGDFHSQNVLIDKGTAAVLDLETVIRGPFVLDIGRSLLDLCHQPDGIGINKQRMDNFLKGYDQIRPLTSQEEDATLSAIGFGCAGLASWLYLKKHKEVGEFFLKIGASIKD